MVIKHNPQQLTLQLLTALLALLILLPFDPVLAAANITARLSHNPVSLDESFHLIYEADSDVDDPDFSVLDRDFEILSSAQSTNMRSINGSWSLKKSWDLTLISKQAGVFTIPPVPFGSESSPSLRITVKASSQAPGAQQNTGGEQAQLFLEVETDSRQAWVRSQIIYTVRLLRNVSISSASLSEPQTSDPDAIIERLGEDASYDTVRNGVRYAVIERRYAIYPQHSGKLVIKPLRFDGHVSTPAARPRSFIDSFMSLNTGNRKRVLSKRLEVDVKPVPDLITLEDWLAANRLELTESWSADLAQLKTGEPVTRTLTLRAYGQLAESLPDINLPEIDGLKQYPDKPQIENIATADGFRGTRQFKVAIMPTRAGVYRLPAIEVPWFNTRTGQQEVASLPPVELVASGTAASAAAPPAEAPTPMPKADIDQRAAAPQPRAGEAPGTLATAGYWPWISLALALGWVATLLLMLQRRTAVGGVRNSPGPKPEKLQPLKRAVSKACRNGHASQTKDALLAWARVCWPDKTVTSLSDIAGLAGEPLAYQIRKLNDALYSPEADWDPVALDSAIKGFSPRAKPGRSVEKPVLEPLYRT